MGLWAPDRCGLCECAEAVESLTHEVAVEVVLAAREDGGPAGPLPAPTARVCADCAAKLGAAGTDR